MCCRRSGSIPPIEFLCTMCRRVDPRSLNGGPTSMLATAMMLKSRPNFAKISQACRVMSDNVNRRLHVILARAANILIDCSEEMPNLILICHERSTLLHNFRTFSTYIVHVSPGTLVRCLSICMAHRWVTKALLYLINEISL